MLAMSPSTVRGLSDAYQRGSASPTLVVGTLLEEIEKRNPSLKWYITVLTDSSNRAAHESELRYKAGKPLGPLDGVPIALKDIFYIKGVRCTAGSKILADNVATYDSPVAQKLKAAGAVLVGTTNLHEFAAGVTSVNPHYGAVTNPWDGSRVAGGSSGGSAAAVAGGLAAAALGTDTAGSVRIPAALCGVLGFKPTYGRVSRLGVIPLASSLDTVGTLTRSAWDAAALLSTISGGEESDVTTAKSPVPDYLGGIDTPLAHPRVGVPRRYFHDLLSPEVESNFSAFVSKLEEVGCHVADTELDGIEEVYDKWLPIRRAEATAFHMRWLDTTPGQYGDDVRRLLELGRGVLAVDYVNALNARPTIIERFLTSMKDVDFLAVPATCIPAPPIGQSKAEVSGKEVEVYHALNRLTLPFNYVGLPAVSVPSGLVGRLPVGVQLVGKLFDEEILLKLVNQFEKAFGPYPPPPRL
jgi:aspartyl-tRNA(Asn)/glutamyl-tRNA(Gln) amidotransferase subunit A